MTPTFPGGAVCSFAGANLEATPASPPGPHPGPGLHIPQCRRPERPRWISGRVGPAPGDRVGEAPPGPAAAQCGRPRAWRALLGAGCEGPNSVRWLKEEGSASRPEPSRVCVCVCVCVYGGGTPGRCGPRRRLPVFQAAPQHAASLMAGDPGLRPNDRVLAPGRAPGRDSPPRAPKLFYF